jgi:tetratricopeptide (TPR) repeat protein
MAMRAVLLLIKLAFAFAVLAIGAMVMWPHRTASWPLAHLVGRVAHHLAAIGAVGREPWGVVILALGVASFLAALPKSVKAKSKPKPKPAPPEATAVVEVRAAPPPELIPVLHASAPNTDHDADLAAARRALEVNADAPNRSHLADLLKKDGDIAESEGRLDQAIAAYEESARLRRAILAVDEANPREQRWLWTTLESLAECRSDRGHRTRAAALYRESLAAAARAVALAPEAANYPAEMAATRAQLTALEAQLTA